MKPKVALAALLVPLAAQQGVKRIHFRRGESAAVVSGAVVRGERDTWVVGARAGQRLSVRVTAREDNAAFQLLRPRGRGTLPRAGEMDDATQWSSRLPDTGEYRIVVGGTRGNAVYRMRVEIR